MITKQEITDIVYDSLMGNLQPPYVVFDLDKVDAQECDAKGGLIMFEYEGMEIKIDISVRIEGGWL